MSNYTKYLSNNRWWRDLRWEVIGQRAGGVCECCNHRPAVQVHHLVYPHGRRERASDLLAVCDYCHFIIHHPTAANDNDFDQEQLALEESG